ncbi:MAG: hypothetical protein R3A44_17410 [Caldilineaceae bacterium]
MISAGANVSAEWLDQRVFALQPHQSHFVIEPAQLLKVPASLLAPEHRAAAQWAETAVNFVMDGRPSD